MEMTFPNFYVPFFFSFKEPEWSSFCIKYKILLHRHKGTNRTSAPGDMTQHMSNVSHEQLNLCDL